MLCCDLRISVFTFMQTVSYKHIYLKYGKNIISKDKCIIVSKNGKSGIGFIVVRSRPRGYPIQPETT